MNLEQFFERATQAFEVLGRFVDGVGHRVCHRPCRCSRGREPTAERAFKTLRNSIGGAILLGLELLVAADIVKTVTSKPSLTTPPSSGLIVLIRTVLSFTIEVEIDGVAPWRKGVDDRSGSAGQDDARRAHSAGRGLTPRIRSEAFSPISTLGA